MMCQHPDIFPHLALPWPGVGLEPTPEQKAAGQQPVKPTPLDDCLNLHQSIGWFERVHELGEGWGPGEYNIALSLNVDGFQPFKRGGITISPISLMILNLPENMRHRAEHMILAGIIPMKEPKDHNVYLRRLVDELLTLGRVGFEFTDPRTQLPRRVKVRLIFTCSDYPAHGHLNAQHHAGRHGCQKCDIKVSAHVCMRDAGGWS